MMSPTNSTGSVALPACKGCSSIIRNNNNNNSSSSSSGNMAMWVEFTLKSDTVSQHHTSSNSSMECNNSSSINNGNEYRELDTAFLATSACLAIFIIFLNTLVCLAFKSEHRLRKTKNTFVVSLALSDLSIGSVYIPAYIHGTITGRMTIVQFVVCFTTLASMLNQCAVAYDVFQSINKPLHYGIVMTAKKVRIILIFVWGIPAVNALVPIPILYGQTLSPATKNSFIRNYSIVQVAFLLICFVAIVVIYSTLHGKAKQHIRRHSSIQSSIPPEESHVMSLHLLRDDPHASAFSRTRKLKNTLGTLKAELHSLRLFSQIAAVHMLCWLPMIYVNLCGVILVNWQPSLLQKLTPMALLYFMYYANIAGSIINPFFYSLLRKDFRDALNRIFRGNFSRKKRQDLIRQQSVRSSTVSQSDRHSKMDGAPYSTKM